MFEIQGVDTRPIWTPSDKDRVLQIVRRKQGEKVFVSQIAVELLCDPKTVVEILLVLQRENEVATIYDPKDPRADFACQPWVYRKYPRPGDL